MDDLDQHLIDKLRDNARAPVAELARALGRRLAETARKLVAIG